MTGLDRCIGLALCCAAALLATAAPAASAACPNEAIREVQGDTALPACMALELLSPPVKFGQEATELGGFAPDSTRALYKSKAALADTEGLQSFIGDSYVGLLNPGFWEAFATAPPKEADIQVGGANFGGPYAFSTDFGKWALLGSTHSQQFPGEGRFFTDGLSEPFEPLSPLLVPINNSGETIQTEIANVAPGGTDANISLTVFPTVFSGTSYFPEDPREVGPGRNNYLVFRDELGQPRMELLARDGAGDVVGGRCGTRLGNGPLNQGAISPDGSRIYFMTRPDQAPSVGTDGPPCNTANPLRIMVREDALAEDATVEQLFTGGTGTGDDLYQGASLDSTKVFLMSPRKLASSDQDVTAEACSPDVGASKGCDLYLYDSSLPEADRLIQVSAGGTGDPDPGKGADVLTSTVALAPDGSHAYFAAQGVLTTTPNPQGATAIAGKANLYLYERDAEHPAGQTSFIGTLAEEDKAKLWGLARSFANGAYAVPLSGGPQGGDGHVLFFTSKAPLTPDSDDTGLADIFRYDADADALTCATCDPALPAQDMVAGPNEGLEVPPSSNFAVHGRWVSEDGETMVFTTAPPALAVGTPYLWKDGQTSELPGEVGVETPAVRPVVSMDGKVAGFTTTEALLPQDGDTARDVYLARVNGGFLPTSPPPVCNPLVEGNCQGPPSAPPPLSAPKSKVPTSGNVKPKPSCRKGFVRKKGKCVKKHKAKAKKKGKGKAGKKRAASKSQGGSK